MKRLLTTTAIGLLLAGPAFAQSAQEQPASPAAPETQQNQPETTVPKTPDTSDAYRDQKSGTESTKPGDTAQSDTLDSGSAGDVLASNLIGASVQNANGEAVGEISDIVFGQDGNAKSAIISVGGFLGIGEKNVAVEFSQLNFNQDERNNLSVTLAMSAESLEAMPEYKAESAETGTTQETETPAMKEQDRAPADESGTPDSQKKL